MFMTGRASWPTLAKSPTVSELRFLLGKMERLHGDGDGVPCLLSGDATSPMGPASQGELGLHLSLFCSLPGRAPSERIFMRGTMVTVGTRHWPANKWSPKAT